MNKIIDFKKWYSDNFEAFEKSLNGANNSPFRELRKDAISRFNQSSLPTLKDEEWKYTNISPLLKHNFTPVTGIASVSSDVVEKYLFKKMEHSLLVFVNGQYSEDKSKLLDLPDTVIAGSLTNAVQINPELVSKHLGKYADTDSQIFTALSTAYSKDGAFVYIPENTVVEEPIHIIFITSAGDKEISVHPRNLFIAEKNSQVTIIEHYVSDSESVHFTNAVTEVVAGENAVVDHIKLQEESSGAFHIARTEIDQERNSNFSSHSISLGSLISRNDINSRFNDEGGECTLNGLFLLKSDQLCDVHTLIDHAKPHCNSHEHYKGILEEKSRGVFNGKVLVRPDAQKTNAFQENNNLLLSDNALVNTKPQLEIFADDVKCSHGATIGQLDEDAKFYLNSRGIGNEAATNILIHAFASDVISSIKIGEVRTYLEKILSDRFNRGKIKI